MSDPVGDMTSLLIGALHAQLRGKLSVAEVTGAVNTVMDQMDYAGLVATVSAANTLTSAVTTAYPAPAAPVAAALGDYTTAKGGLGGPNAEIP